MLSSVEQAFVGREEIRAPLKAPAWEAIVNQALSATHSARIFAVCEQLVPVLFFDHSNNVEFVDLL